jgi:hypothetical protein
VEARASLSLVDQKPIERAQRELGSSVGMAKRPLEREEGGKFCRPDTRKWRGHAGTGNPTPWSFLTATRM